MSLLKRKSLLAIFATIIMVIGMLFASIPVKTAHAASGSESESNNTAETANTISVNTTISGNLSSSSDVDWFKFTTSSNGSFYIDFQHELLSSSSTYWKIYVYDSTATNTIDGSGNPVNTVVGNANKVTASVGISQGTYYIKIVKSNHSSNTYQLKVCFTSSNNWEKENNNSKDKATIINLNEFYSASITDTNDVDWFKFTTSSNGSFYIDFQHELLSSSSTYWKIYVYDSTGVNVIDGSGNNINTVVGNVNKITATSGIPAGTYFIKIIDSNHSQNTYQLKVCFTSSNNWEKENNNSKDNATPINLNEQYFAALTDSADDDWFKFTIPTDGVFYIDFQHEFLSSSSTYWKIYIYDETGVTSIDGSSSYFGVVGNENRCTNNIGVKAGSYYIKIIDSNHSQNTYSLKVCFSEESSWETEINNSKDTADIIEVNEVYKGSLSTNGDVDWYKFTVSSNCQVAISFNHEVINSGSTYWKIILFDNTAVTKLYTFSRYGNTATAISDYVDVTPGTYYAKVEASNYSGKDYELSIIEKHDHRGEWIQTVEPTCTEGGSESRECTICGLVETRDLEALGHKYNSGEQIEEATIVKKGKIEYTCEQCGDQYTEDDKSKVWILPVICVGGVLVIIGLINYIRMMKKKN